MEGRAATAPGGGQGSGVAPRRLWRTLTGPLAVPWLFGGLSALAIRLPMLGDRVALDASVYLAGGFAWSRGDVPYRDLFDHKGPLNSEIFLALDWLLPSSAVLVRLVFLALFVASMAQLTALLRRHAPGAAWPAVAIYAIAASSPLLQGQDLNTEQIALPLMIAAVDFADRSLATRGGWRAALGWAAAAGAVIVAATALKSIYAIAATPLPAILLWRRAPLLLAAASGGAGAALAILLPFAFEGVLDEMWRALFGYSGRFASAGWGHVLDGGPGSLVRYLDYFPSYVLPALGLCLGAVACADRDRRRLVIGAATAALAGWIAARSPGQSFAHYFLLSVPGLAVLCGLGVDSIARRAPALRWPVAAVVVAPVLGVFAIGPLGDALAIPGEYRWGTFAIPALSREDDAARIVAEATRPDERIYVATPVAGAGQAIYWKARRRPASRFIFPGDVVPPAYDRVAARLVERPPAAIVVMPGAPEEVTGPAIEAGGLAEVAALDSGPGLVLRIYARRAPPRSATAATFNRCRPACGDPSSPP